MLSKSSPGLTLLLGTGSVAGTPMEFSERSHQNLLFKWFCHLLLQHKAGQQNLLYKSVCHLTAQSRCVQANTNSARIQIFSGRHLCMVPGVVCCWWPGRGTLRCRRRRRCHWRCHWRWRCCTPRRWRTWTPPRGRSWSGSGGLSWGEESLSELPSLQGCTKRRFPGCVKMGE